MSEHVEGGGGAGARSPPAKRVREAYPDLTDVLRIMALQSQPRAAHAPSRPRAASWAKELYATLFLCHEFLPSVDPMYLARFMPLALAPRGSFDRTLLHGAARAGDVPLVTRLLEPAPTPTPKRGRARISTSTAPDALRCFTRPPAATARWRACSSTATPASAPC